MIVLADNDIILKLAQCDLLGDLPRLLGEPADQIFVTPTAHFQLLPKRAGKALEKCGSEAALTGKPKPLGDGSRRIKGKSRYFRKRHLIGLAQAGLRHRQTEIA